MTLKAKRLPLNDVICLLHLVLSHTPSTVVRRCESVSCQSWSLRSFKVCWSCTSIWTIRGFKAAVYLLLGGVKPVNGTRWYSSSPTALKHFYDAVSQSWFLSWIPVSSQGQQDCCFCWENDERDSHSGAAEKSKIRFFFFSHSYRQ